MLEDAALLLFGAVVMREHERMPICYGGSNACTNMYSPSKS